MKSTRKGKISLGIVVGVCVLVFIIHHLFVNHENGILFGLSIIAGLIYFCVLTASGFQMNRLSYIGGVVVCSVVILIAVLLYFDSTTFPVRAMYKMERYAKSHALQEPGPTGNKINVGGSRASYYMFFTTKEGEPRMLIVRETEEGLEAVEEIPIPVVW